MGVTEVNSLHLVWKCVFSCINGIWFGLRTLGPNNGVSEEQLPKKLVCKLLADSLPAVGQLSVCLPTDGWQTADSWPTLDRQMADRLHAL